MPTPIYDAALRLHEQAPCGKLAIQPTKPLRNTQDLSLAYSPGVAGPVLEIAKNPDDAWKYTAKGNLVAVISNGTAILGLGNRGALASKPVMEGKAVLFKRFADVDAFDLELDTEDPEKIIETVALLEPTFGGINLEDIKAPECFAIERALVERLSIPVFHDDQHGTAVVACAGILNALIVAGKQIGSVAIVLNGAGAAGLSVARMLLALGCDPKRLTVCDSKGVLTTERTDLNHAKQPFARKTASRTLGDAIRGADVFVGVSAKGTLSADMLATMATDPIVFALANPDPEIDPALARATRSDVILATGRSDTPNQVNNLLCFPFLFRGALDTRARRIDDAMKRAAVTALAELAREPVPQEVLVAYGLPSLAFGRGCLLPKPFDARLLPTVSCAVAEAAMQSGSSRVQVNPLAYRKTLAETAKRLAA